MRASSNRPSTRADDRPCSLPGASPEHVWQALSRRSANRRAARMPRGWCGQTTRHGNRRLVAPAAASPASQMSGPGLGPCGECRCGVAGSAKDPVPRATALARATAWVSRRPLGLGTRNPNVSRETERRGPHPNVPDARIPTCRTPASQRAGLRHQRPPQAPTMDGWVRIEAAAQPTRWAPAPSHQPAEPTSLKGTPRPFERRSTVSDPWEDLLMVRRSTPPLHATTDNSWRRRRIAPSKRAPSECRYPLLA
jgi:hypothetical protein